MKKKFLIALMTMGVLSFTASQRSYAGAYSIGVSWGGHSHYSPYRHHYRPHYYRRHGHRHHGHKHHYGHRYHGYRGGHKHERVYSSSKVLGALVLGGIIGHFATRHYYSDRHYQQSKPVYTRRVFTSSEPSYYRVEQPSYGTRYREGSYTSRINKDLDGSCYRIVSEYGVVTRTRIADYFCY